MNDASCNNIDKNNCSLYPCKVIHSLEIRLQCNSDYKFYMSSGSVVLWESGTAQSPQPRANTPTAGRPKPTIGQAQAVQGHNPPGMVQF